MKAGEIFVGKVVDRAATIHDYTQIFFKDGSILNIYNKMTLSGDRNKGLASLAGLTVSEALEQADSIRLSFGKEISVQVGMSDNDFSGPEAMQYVHGKQFVVW